jgi:hypothetical protein
VISIFENENSVYGALYPNLSEKKIFAPLPVPLRADLAAALTYGLTSINILPVLPEIIEP